MKPTECSTCLSPKAKYECKRCQEPVCKDCGQFVDDDRTAFLATSQAKDSADMANYGGVYCSRCFDQEIAPALARYDQLVEQARELPVFSKDQGKETRLFKRSDKTFRVDECDDKDETVLRLAFMAVQAGFNCLVDVDLSYAKSREGSFKILKWSGKGTGATADSKRLGR